ncbi:hypothetical protein ABIB57_002397 [Devosia sp. UYZn731]|uniref:hypothetical protein n=1 Tax=Devosia sp. UYZn731 TaxID=3156345 RepID=UPI003392A1D6
MTKFALPTFALLALTVLLSAPAFAQTGEPSRPADDRCAWEKLSDAKVGLSAWVERCDFGDRKIDLHFDGNTVVEKYSDGGDAEPVIQIFDLKDGETEEAGLNRIYAEHTDPATASRCVAADADYGTVPAGVRRYSFVPNAEYAAELEKSASPDELPEPPCGDLGEWPDGIQYFEAHDNAHKILFVIAGQDAPLFDEQTLELVSP